MYSVTLVFTPTLTHTPSPRHPPPPIAKFLVPDWGDKIDSGIGLSYPTGPPATQDGRPVRQPYVEVNYVYIPVRDYEFGYSLVSMHWNTNETINRFGFVALRLIMMNEVTMD